MSVVIEALRRVDWTGKKVLVACSGGVDSMVLLHGLLETGVRPEVLHVNYQLRGDASDGDQQLVKKTAETAGLTCSVHYCPTATTKHKGANLQAEARAFRRELFTEWTSRSTDHVVALAHHSDDQLETFFLQLLRGSGTFGLGGMHPQRNGLIRPFLTISKEDIYKYAREHAVGWREDASNAESDYLRNLFRNELLPELEASIPTLKGSALLLMAQFRQEQQRLIDSLGEMMDHWKRNGIPATMWLQLDEAQKLAFIHETQLPLWAIVRFNQLATGNTGACFNVGELLFRKSANGTILKIDRQEIPDWDYKIEEVGILPDEFNKNAVYLDADKIAGTLVFRSMETGDRIKSLGLDGSQLVSDVLKDAGIPIDERLKIPILTDDSDILWIPGIKVGRTAIADTESQRILKVSAANDNPRGPGH